MQMNDKFLNAMNRLQSLLAQDQFELLLPECQGAEVLCTTQTNEEKISDGTIKKDRNTVTRQDIRLVYLMNDTVESFLVFKQASFTGEYNEDYDGPLEASCSEDRERYVLSVRQGDSVITLFFYDLELEVHLYDYGDVAHFWVPRFENLRQLEFRIAVLWDKYTYLGEEYCTDGEKRLVDLANVPAMNFCSYCSIPDIYMVPHEIDADSFEKGLDVMEEIAAQTGDRALVRMIRFYRKHPSAPVAAWVARALRRSSHFAFVRALTEQIRAEAGVYPHRSFGEKADAVFAERLSEAAVQKKELEKSGAYVEVLREEPFTVARDHLSPQVYLLVTRRGLRNQKLEIIRCAPKASASDISAS